LKKEEKRSSISSSRAEVRTHCPLRLCLLTDRNSFLVIILLNFLASWQRISFQIEVSPTLFLHIPYTPYTHRTHRTYTLRTYTVRAQEEQWDSRAEAKNDIRDRLANLSVLPGISAKGQANGQVRTVYVRSYVRMFFTSIRRIMKCFVHYSHSFHCLLLFSLSFSVLRNIYLLFVYFLFIMCFFHSLIYLLILHLFSLLL
jgi:hypothetical protein